ncbi:hypothetical protein RND71_038924 [Anisodus tanguticus]|uniref:Uncharacterized protein n=1 Tax=Anisodus tanguticus TaxID=243964 RepID=A0AAE1R119_9SOLA|nr:hypothetical protein RND71_038924 [Anisodus tanguticus]
MRDTLENLLVTRTAGVWRIAAIDEAGGWKDRTTVEDMDLAVRASLKGWKFLFLSSVKKVSLLKKLHVICSFFFVRKVVAHIVTFVFYVVVLPATVLVPEVEVPKWGAVYIPAIITLLNAVGTPRSLHLLVFWILFENAMSLHRTKATFIGLLEAGRVNEWIVTEKLGDALKLKSAAKAFRKHRTRLGDSMEMKLPNFKLKNVIYDNDSSDYEDENNTTGKELGLPLEKLNWAQNEIACA